MSRLEILYQDEHYVAISKPAGLLVHRTWIAGAGECTDFAMQRLRDQMGRWVYPIHRLDRPTSGVMLFALSPEAARELAGAFEARGVDKHYLAVVRGFTEPQGVIDYPLREHKRAAAQAAITAYRRLATVELPIPVGRYATARYSLVEVTPHTGRMHQIRKHFAHIFHPVVGDTAHGEGRHNRLFREHFAVHRLLLAATRLAFFHPQRRCRIVIDAPLDPQLAMLFRRLGWSPPARAG